MYVCSSQRFILLACRYVCTYMIYLLFFVTYVHSLQNFITTIFDQKNSACYWSKLNLHSHCAYVKKHTLHFLKSFGAVSDLVSATQSFAVFGTGAPQRWRLLLHFYRTAGWPGEFVKKIAQNVAQHIFCQSYYAILTKKSSPIFCAASLIFKNAENEQSPIGRKFARSGHPVEEPQL
jgi:hypothetical protein